MRACTQIMFRNEIFYLKNKPNNNKKFCSGPRNYLIKQLSRIRGAKGASSVAQTVNNLPEMQEIWIQSLGGEIPWRKKWPPTPVFLPR